METTSKQLLYDFELTNQSNQEVMEIMNSCFDLLQMKFKNTEFMKFMFYRLQDTIHEFDKIMYESSVGLVEDNLVRKLKPSIFIRQRNCRVCRSTFRLCVSISFYSL